MARPENSAAAGVAATTTTSCREGYVSWEEVFVSGRKGRKEVYYLLKRRGGGSDLAVVGKEKSSTHMSYHIRNSSLGPYSKLRTRREVIDWLDSIVAGSSAITVGKPGREPEIGALKDNQCQKMPQPTKETSWIGVPWTCRKKRKHYQSFKRNGYQISVYDFVFILAEEHKHLVAYLEDLYEDSRGSKMVSVRWFHKIDEVGIVLPRNFSDREVFFSPYLQDLSVECIDGMATVLSPQHYEKFQNEACHTHPEPPFVCYQKFENDDVKPFDITQIRGYWKQEILRDMYTVTDSKSNGSSRQSDDGPELVENLQSTIAGIRPKKRQRCTKEDRKDVLDPVSLKLDNMHISKIETKISIGNNSLKFVGSATMDTIKATNGQTSQYLAVGSQVEVLSQDSGIRGCWFRASIMKRGKDKVKVQYQDIQDAVEEDKKLEEWVLAARIAVPDDLGLWMHGRTRVRPAPPSTKSKISWAGAVGSVVDAWWNDGWWEGIIVQKDSEANYHVYFPGEKMMLVFEPGNLRHSQDWTGNEWVKVRERPELVTSVLSSLKVKQTSSKSCDSKSTIASTGDGVQSKLANGLDSQTYKPRKSEVPDLLKGEVLRWKSSRKRSRSGASRRKPLRNDRQCMKSPQILESDASDSFVIPASLKVDHDDCKFSGDPTIFSSSVVPPSLTNLVMCR